MRLKSFAQRREKEIRERDLKLAVAMKRRCRAIKKVVMIFRAEAIGMI